VIKCEGCGRSVSAKNSRRAERLWTNADASVAEIIWTVLIGVTVVSVVAWYARTC
jgi:hypothetical protein